MVIRSPVCIISIWVPSKDTSTSSSVPFLPSPISISISSSPDKITLLVFSACEQIGVTTSSDAVGSTIGPPAERLYAVEPVGVETVSYTHLTLPTIA